MAAGDSDRLYFSRRGWRVTGDALRYIAWHGRECARLGVEPFLMVGLHNSGDVFDLPAGDDGPREKRIADGAESVEWFWLISTRALPLVEGKVLALEEGRPVFVAADEGEPLP